MKHTLLISALMSFFLLIILVNSVNAEMYLWQTQIVDNSTQIVRDHAYYQFEDTSGDYSGTGSYVYENFFDYKYVGRAKGVDVLLWYEVEPLPYNISAYYPSFINAEVDWCNFTYTHFKNVYNDAGQITNTSTETNSLFFQNTPLSYGYNITVNMHDKDSLVADMDCHYTNAQTLYIDGILFGRFTTYTPTFECKGCEEYSLEQITKQTEANLNMSNTQVGMIQPLQYVVRFDYFLWLVASWLFKIGAFLFLIGLAVGGLFYIYHLIKDLQKNV